MWTGGRVCVRIEQVINLNSGALPADLEYVEERTVGASLGAAAVRAGVLASLAGLGRVLLFMLFYYRLTGIVDTHVTSLIAAAFLFQFGTTPIRGFATTLAIGLLANVFTAVFVSRTLFEVALRHRPMPHTLGIGGSQLFANARANVTRWRWHALVLSLVIIGAGTATVITRGVPLGIDFSGRTLVVVEFKQGGLTEEQVRAAVSGLPGDEIVQRYGAPADHQFLIRLPLASSGSNGLDVTVRQIAQALHTAALAEVEFEKRELVSAVIGSDLQRRGIYAVVASLAAIALYLGIRFRFAFAVGAIAATLHDVLVTLACVSLAGYDLSTVFIASATAILLTGHTTSRTRSRDTKRNGADILPEG